MDRIYRVSQGGPPFYAVERDGALPRRRPGRPDFFRLRAGGADCRRPRRRDAPGARDAVEDRLRRPQLQGARGGDGQGASARAAHFHQAAIGGRRARRRDPAAAGRRPRRSRGRAGRRHRPPRAPRGAGPGMGLYSRADVRQRRDGARSAEEGVAVHALQGLRHVRAHRAVHCRRPERRRAPDRRMGQRRAASVVFHVAPDLSDRRARAICNVRDDTRAGRRHFDRHARRDRPARSTATPCGSSSKASASS